MPPKEKTEKKLSGVGKLVSSVPDELFSADLNPFEFWSASSDEIEGWSSSIDQAIIKIQAGYQSQLSQSKQQSFVALNEFLQSNQSFTQLPNQLDQVRSLLLAEEDDTNSLQSLYQESLKLRSITRYLQWMNWLRLTISVCQYLESIECFALSSFFIQWSLYLLSLPQLSSFQCLQLVRDDLIRHRLLIQNTLIHRCNALLNESSSSSLTADFFSLQQFINSNRSLDDLLVDLLPCSSSFGSFPSQLLEALHSPACPLHLLGLELPQSSSADATLTSDSLRSAMPSFDSLSKRVIISELLHILRPTKNLARISISVSCF